LPSDSMQIKLFDRKGQQIHFEDNRVSVRAGDLVNYKLMLEESAYYGLYLREANIQVPNLHGHDIKIRVTLNKEESKSESDL